MKNTYKSRVYTDRPDYADFEAPAKFEAIKSIIAKRLTEHPKAICSYSGGADSDIMLDLIERTRAAFELPPIKYVFFNTGLEMKATKDHVRETAEKYGVEIEECRPKINIVQAARNYGIPFVSKIMSAGLSDWQKKGIPLSIAEEYDKAEEDERHICPLQLEVIKRCICLWTNPGDIVLDPFAGIGSTNYMALRLDRRTIGIELKDSYYVQAAANCKMALNEVDSGMVQLSLL